ncbi:MAG: phosphate ABC transporter permease subunit PstC [Blastocatellia bacterium]|nr:phosphate ABC transporter permease subunit PstC [Chloracidobacterium sp.]MBL8183833.1 phosphate ABC transporter permease subunit PstC [Blastocatellia bacterium]HBE81888.1 phosphate ABC transporter permease subunit PstC [Blastocatellia bacterium]HRJ89420.1 phosphate ABC transporter permease subunit PstC [Pyrinomonadaceae bacterium]HRK51929.1 phosphate ABC transporter permease subunit PstC [Pyrinomonadaceae bacterium]
MARSGTLGDKVYRTVLLAAAISILLIVAAVLYMMVQNSLPTIQRFGAGFLFASEWNPSQEKFGALPFIYGTVVSSILALILAVPISLGIAIFLVEQAPKSIARPIAFMVELLAAIPSVVYGLWGIFVLAPFIRNYLGPVLQDNLGFLPLFQGRLTGIGMFTGGIILALMITPIITAVVRDVLEAVPNTQREAALALGATKWETTMIVLGNAASGIAGAVVLGLGRAVGETMAVTMVIGNSPQITASLFEPAYTIASVLAANFADATEETYLSALIEMALVLFLVTVIINALAKLMIMSVAGRANAAKHV